MNIQLPGLTLMATLVLLLAPAAQAATDCVAGYQQINNNNSILMLGERPEGPSNSLSSVSLARMLTSKNA